MRFVVCGLRSFVVLSRAANGQLRADNVIAFVATATDNDPAASLVAKDAADTGPDWAVTIDDVIAFMQAYATGP